MKNKIQMRTIVAFVKKKTVSDIVREHLTGKHGGPAQ